MANDNWGDLDLRRDPVFIRVGNELEAIQQFRITELKRIYNIVGFNSLGGAIRPKMLACNMSNENMFDGSEPKLGDVVALGYVYTDKATEVLVCRLSQYHEKLADKRVCNNNTGYKFSWTVEAIETHQFDEMSKADIAALMAPKEELEPDTTNVIPMRHYRQTPNLMAQSVWARELYATYLRRTDLPEAAIEKKIAEFDEEQYDILANTIFECIHQLTKVFRTPNWKDRITPA